MRLPLLLGALLALAAAEPTVVMVQPEDVPAYEAYNEGTQAHGAADWPAAEAHYRRALRLKPDIFEAYNNLGIVLQKGGRYDEAIAVLLTGVEVAAGDPRKTATALNNVGHSHRDRAGVDQLEVSRALDYYRRSMELQPDFDDAVYNYASALQTLGRVGDAEKAFEHLLTVNPAHPEGRLNLANLYFARYEYPDAVRLYESVIAEPMDTPMQPETRKGALLNLGNLLYRAGEPALAAETHSRTLRLYPDSADAFACRTVARKALCAWQGFETDFVRVRRDALAQAAAGEKTALMPYDSLTMPSDPELIYAVATSHMRAWRDNAARVAPTTAKPADHNRKLNVGYLSYDFREHVMGHLTAGVIEATAPSCFSYGENDGSALRAHFERACQPFVDVEHAADLDAAAAVAAHDVHVLVDMMVETTSTRQAIAGAHPAPIVVNYLGYPGTSGSPHHDVALVDAVVAPPEAQRWFSEKLALLPHTYQANRYAPQACPAAPHVREQARAAVGLPSRGFVMASFNSMRKLDPHVFALWMDVLIRVPGSALWMLATEDQVRGLRLEMASRGVLPRRLVVADKMPKARHLQRLCLADALFDTLDYGAHTTAADALSAGVPVVTLLGEAFPSRVAASLLRSAGLPALVTHSEREYYNVALRVVAHAAAARRAVTRRTPDSPLFDWRRQAGDLDHAYRGMWEVHEAMGGSVAHIVVSPSSGGSFQSFEDLTARGAALWEADDLAGAHAAFLQALPRAPPQHCGMSHTNVGHTHRMLGEVDAARDHYVEALRCQPTDGPLLLATAQFLRHHKQWRPLWDLFDAFGGGAAGLDAEQQGEAFQLWATASVELGEWEHAVEGYRRALAANPRDQQPGIYLSALLRQLGRDEESWRATVDAVQARHRLRHTPGRRPPRPDGGAATVVIFCDEYGQTWWPRWGPRSLGSGVGGSEEAVIFMSRELVALGFRVEVYQDVPDEDVGQDAHGVHWFPLAWFDAEHDWQFAFVAWRYSISLPLGRRSGSAFVYLQDNVSPLPQALDWMQGAFVLSRFQAAAMHPPAVRRAAIITPNAMSADFFVDGANAPQRFIYASSPSRGLQTVLEEWPRIRARLPAARLTVAYGFTPKFVEWARAHMADYDGWRAAMDWLLDQPGVEYVGLLDHEALARAYAAAGFSLYPTTFPETGCVSMMKAMAMGAVPVTSRFENSTLPELTGRWDLGPAEPIGPLGAADAAWRARWVDAVVGAAARNDERHRADMKAWARRELVWGAVARKWLAAFTRGALRLGVGRGDGPVLVANTASLCGYTDQLGELQRLHERFGPRGLTVVAIPTNDFGQQEPWDMPQVRRFYRERYGVSFPVLDKARVGEHAFFQAARLQLGHAAFPQWNFYKYLIDADGNMVAAFPSGVSPLAGEVEGWISTVL